MAQSWTADPNSLNQLIGLLRESQSNPQHQSGVSEVSRVAVDRQSLHLHSSIS